MASNRFKNISEKQRQQCYQLLAYIREKIKYRKIDLIRKNIKTNTREVLIGENQNIERTTYSSQYFNQKYNTDTYIENEFLRRSINNLPERQRDFIKLHYLQGYSQKEIADMLNVSPSAISQLKGRAIDNFRIFYKNNSK